jgi:aryl-alcohol dehydrogenase-like predicted oxidoreductase
MNKRQLGKTGIEVSEIGFGAWQLGNEKDWGKMDDHEAIDLVHEAIDRGCNFFDTAPNYGLGKSESIIGEALKDKRSQVVISSKCGHLTSDEKSFEPDYLIESIESSLKRLKTDYLDIVLLHNPPFEMLTDESPQFKVLEKLKAAGKIRFYGASVDSSTEIDAILKNTSSQVIEIMFNIFYQEPKDAIKRAHEKGVGIITKVPLDSGWLTGKYGENSTFTGIRDRWTSEVIEKRSHLVNKVRAIIGEDRSMAKVALQYILMTDGVSSVIPGARNTKQLSENILAAEQHLPREIKTALNELWETEIKDSPLPW